MNHLNHKENEVYTCPMHPQVRKSEPGRCPACGMELILEKKDKSHANHDMGGHDMQNMNHADHEAAMTNPQIAKAMEVDMRKRFLVSFLLSIPIFLYSPVGVSVFKLNLPTPIPINWLLFILTTPIVFWAGSIFITGTYYSLRAKLNMSCLLRRALPPISLAFFLHLSVPQKHFMKRRCITFVLLGIGWK